MSTSAYTDSELGGRLSAAMRAVGMSQTQLAAELGVQTSTVSNWVNNSRSPGDDSQLARIGELLGASPAWLRSGTGPAPAGVRLQAVRRAQGRLGWYAKKVGAEGAREGGNAALFTITPTLGHVVREAIQNSIDATLGA